MSSATAPVPPSPDRPLRVAVIGAGPAGIYAADALAQQDAVPVAVDLVDRLPTPFGLVRHGIAPDHPKMRAIRDTLHRTLESPAVRFVGNVDVGTVPSTSNLAGKGSWLAGATSLSAAKSNCAKPALTPKGRVTLTQYVQSGLDRNNSCV